MGLSVSTTEVSRRTNFEACPRRCLTQGGVRTVGAQEMDFTGLNEAAIGGVFSPCLAGNKTSESGGNVGALFGVGAKVACR